MYADQLETIVKSKPTRSTREDFVSVFPDRRAIPVQLYRTIVTAVTIGTRGSWLVGRRYTTCWGIRPCHDVASLSTTGDWCRLCY